MKRILFVIIASLMLAYPADQAIAAQAATKEPQKEMSKEDAVKRLNALLKDHPDVMSVIPGFSVKEENGQKAFAYNNKRLEDLDNDTAVGLFMAANRYITRKNIERIQQQLRTLNQINDLSRLKPPATQATPQPPPQTPPSTPTSYTPPTVPNNPERR